MRRMCECGLHYRNDRPYPRLLTLDMHTEAICTSATDPLAKELNHATFIAGRRYGVLSIRIPYVFLDLIICLRRVMRLIGAKVAV